MEDFAAQPVTLHRLCWLGLQVAGCLLIDSKVLKTRLAPVVTDTASDIKDVLTIIARNECLNVAEELQKRNAVLTARPEELDGFMAYRVAHSEQFTERQAALSQMEKVRAQTQPLWLLSFVLHSPYTLACFSQRVFCK